MMGLKDMPISLLELFQADFRRFVADLENLSGSKDIDCLEFWSRVQEKLEGISGCTHLLGLMELAQWLEQQSRACDLLGERGGQHKHFEYPQWLACLYRLMDGCRVLLQHLKAEHETDLEQWLEVNQGLLDGKFNTAQLELAQQKMLADADHQDDFVADHKDHETTRGLSSKSMHDLFLLEASTQSELLSDRLLALERNPQSPIILETLMRAAHSFKGAGRMVGKEEITALAHKLEDCFVAAQNGELLFDAEGIDVALEAVDRLQKSAQMDKAELTDELDRIEASLSSLDDLLSSNKKKANRKKPSTRQSSVLESPVRDQDPLPDTQGAVRVNADTLTKMIALSQENKNNSAWLRKFSSSLLMLKKRQFETSKTLSRLNESILDFPVTDLQAGFLVDLKRQANEAQERISQQLQDLEEYDRRVTNVSTRLNQAVLSSRMRPFIDSVHGKRRMVRDLARVTGKRVRLELIGQNTQVDRDILEKLEAPINHLLRNAVDHGFETPESRIRLGKPVEGTLILRAGHKAGALTVTVEDDGGGIDLEKIRSKIMEKGLVDFSVAARLEAEELYDFLFQPSFSTRNDVSEISGRGVGLDAVRAMVDEVGGTIKIQSESNRFTRFIMQLPVTRSVVRSLLVRIAGELYAFPLIRVDQVFYLDDNKVKHNGKQSYIKLDNHYLGLIRGRQLFDIAGESPFLERHPVVIVGKQQNRFGIVVDEFVGEELLIVHALDPQLGKVVNVTAAAIVENGDPVLILDVDEILVSICRLVESGSATELETIQSKKPARLRVLLVDDSVIVREIVRTALENRGYQVELAFDGIAGWKRIRQARYDLVITDYEMPGMDGMELSRRIKSLPVYEECPLILFTTREDEEVRLAALKAGANHFVVKSRTHESLLEIVDSILPCKPLPTGS